MRDVALRIPESVFVDAFGAKQGHVKVPSGDFFKRPVAGDHRVAGQEKSAGDIDLDARQAGNQLRRRQTSRHDLQVGDAGGGDGFGGEEDGRTRVEVDRHAGLDARGGHVADLALGLGVLDLAIVERREVAVEVRQRAAMGTRDATLVLEFGQVATSRRL